MKSQTCLSKLWLGNEGQRTDGPGIGGGQSLGSCRDEATSFALLFKLPHLVRDFAQFLKVRADYRYCL